MAQTINYTKTDRFRQCTSVGLDATGIVDPRITVRWPHGMKAHCLQVPNDAIENTENTAELTQVPSRTGSMPASSKVEAWQREQKCIYTIIKSIN